MHQLISCLFIIKVQEAFSELCCVQFGSDRNKIQHSSKWHHRGVVEDEVQDQKKRFMVKILPRFMSLNPVQLQAAVMELTTSSKSSSTDQISTTTTTTSTASTSLNAATLNNICTSSRGNSSVTAHISQNAAGPTQVVPTVVPDEIFH